MLCAKLFAIACSAVAVHAVAPREIVKDVADLEPLLAGFVFISDFQGNGLNLANNFDGGIFDGTAVTGIPTAVSQTTNQQVSQRIFDLRNG